ncbi:hypothetical protein KCP78_21770 [Salmonella enterica subsp. enterica]|nr:hypothetical protein KCP78_21770 [Salmonella enterica subsp. enterica]
MLAKCLLSSRPFENQNIAFYGGPRHLPSPRAATSHHSAFHVLVKILLTRGAMLGGWLGLLTAVVLMILGPTLFKDPRPRKSDLPV